MEERNEEDEIIYENLSITNEEVKDEVKDEVKENVDNEVDENSTNDENNEVVEENNNTVDEVKDDENETVNDRVFKLKYNNFLSVKETKGLFLFFLDKQTVIILPKETYQNGSDFTSFKEFISTKINVKRIKFLKDKE